MRLHILFPLFHFLMSFTQIQQNKGALLLAVATVQRCLLVRILVCVHIPICMYVCMSVFMCGCVKGQTESMDWLVQVNESHKKGFSSFSPASLNTNYCHRLVVTKLVTKVKLCWKKKQIHLTKQTHDAISVMFCVFVSYDVSAYYHCMYFCVFVCTHVQHMFSVSLLVSLLNRNIRENSFTISDFL